MTEDNQVHCPKCDSTQITANKKGFSGKKAVAGAILTGGIGLLAGTLGSNKVKITCLACGHVFNPGDRKQEAIPSKEDPLTAGGCVVLIIIFAIIAYAFYSC